MEEKNFRVWIFSVTENSTYNCDCYYDRDTDIQYDIKGARSVDLTATELRQLRRGLYVDNRNYAILVRDLTKQEEGAYEGIASTLIDRGRDIEQKEILEQERREARRLKEEADRDAKFLERKKKQLEKLQQELKVLEE